MTASTSGSGIPRSGVASRKLRESGPSCTRIAISSAKRWTATSVGRSFVGAIGLEELVDRIDDADRELAAAGELAVEQQRRVRQVVADLGALIAVEREVEIERHHDELHAEVAQHRSTARAEHLAREPRDASGRRSTEAPAGARPLPRAARG